MCSVPLWILKGRIRLRLTNSDGSARNASGDTVSLARLPPGIPGPDGSSNTLDPDLQKGHFLMRHWHYSFSVRIVMLHSHKRRFHSLESKLVVVNEFSSGWATSSYTAPEPKRFKQNFKICIASFFTDIRIVVAR